MTGNAIREALEPFAKAARAFEIAIGPDGIDDGLTVEARISARPAYEAVLSTADFSRARTAYDAIGSGAGVKVRELEWHDGVEPGMWYGDGAFGHRYQITKSKMLTGPDDYTFNTYLDEEGSVSLAWPDTLDEAKAAAQADFERRVLACLAHTAAGAGPVGEVSVELMQRIWANLFYDEEDAGFSYQGTLNDVVDWLAAKNALPDVEVREIGAELERAAGKPLTEGSWGGLAVEPVARAIAQDRAGPVGEVSNADLAQMADCQVAWIAEGAVEHPHRLQTIRDALDRLSRLPDPAEPCQVVWMNHNHLASYRNDPEHGIAWAASEQTDFYDTPLYARPVDEPGEVERLTRERDNAIAAAKMLTGSHAKLRTTLTETLERLEKERDRGFNHGYLMAVANIINLHRETVVAADVLLQIDLTIDDAESFELAEYDMEALNRLRSEPRAAEFFKRQRRDAQEAKAPAGDA